MNELKAVIPRTSLIDPGNGDLDDRLIFIAEFLEVIDRRTQKVVAEYHNGFWKGSASSSAA